jgi:hypothetical protein
MKSHVEIEQLLKRLGNEWPADNLFVDNVMRRIEAQPLRPASRTIKWPLMKSVLATAASLAVVSVLWWKFHDNRMLYAQAIDGIRRARTVQMITSVQPAADKPTQPALQSWYERGVGFRAESASEVRLGNQKNFWTYSKDTKLAIRSDSHGIDDIVDRMLNNEDLQVLKEVGEFERYSAGDQKVDGQPFQAYLVRKLKGSTDPDWKAGTRRIVILLDAQSRIARSFAESRSEGRWVVQRTIDWKYDVQIDSALFEPHFGADVKIVDLDALFDAFVDLQKAVYREERSGLWYAIHRAERFDGGILVVSSVRGTAETLKKYPLAPRRQVGMGLFVADGPAVNYEASPQGNGYFRIDLAKASHEGIDVRWWLLVPRGTPSTRFDIAPGKVKLPVGITPHGEFAKANFADERGVIHHLTWDVEIDLPRANPLPTLDVIARQVYADQVVLEVVPFTQLDMGSKDHVEQFSVPGKTTPAEFSTAVAAHIRSWMQRDLDFQLEGQFTMPKDHVPTNEAADFPAMGFMYNRLVDDGTLARVAKHESLKRLYLQGTKITDAGLRQLAGLKELHSLSVADTTIGDAGLKDLEGLSALRDLDIQNTQVTADGVTHLKAAIPALKVKY